jgi:divalent metal cation (Fe/Co/Zn/Cd) transporter
MIVHYVYGKGKGMEYINKLPFMLGAFMAIVIGIVSYEFHVSQQETYIRMVIGMITFYLIGIFIRNTIAKILDEVTRKKEEMLKEMKEREKLNLEELKKQNENINASKFDFKIDERFDNDENFEEDFMPLAVNEILRS